MFPTMIIVECFPPCLLWNVCLLIWFCIVFYRACCGISSYKAYCGLVPTSLVGLAYNSKSCVLHTCTVNLLRIFFTYFLVIIQSQTTASSNITPDSITMVSVPREELLACLVGMWELGWVSCHFYYDDIISVTVLAGNPLGVDEPCLIEGEHDVLKCVLRQLPVWFGPEVRGLSRY